MSTCEDCSDRGNACEAGIRWPDDVRPCRRLNLHDRRADLDCITVNMLPAISVFCDLRQMCYCVMLSRLFVDIGQIRWVHELHALYMSGCIYEYVQYRLIATSSLRLVWPSDFVGATCNGWAAKYLLMVVDIAGTGNALRARLIPT